MTELFIALLPYGLSIYGMIELICGKHEPLLGAAAITVGIAWMILKRALNSALAA